MIRHTIAVQTYYSGAWHDLVADQQLYLNPTMTFARYASSLTRRTDPARMTGSLVNADGRFNPENPLSPLYGLAGRDTPIRIIIDGLVQWSGTVATWRPSRSLGNIRRVAITGGSVLRRLGLGTPPVVSAIMTAVLAMSPTLYLPLVEGPYATGTGPGDPGTQIITLDGINFGAIPGPPGDTRPLPEMVSDGVGGLTAWTVDLPTATGTAWTVDVAARAVRQPNSGLTVNTFNILNWRTGLSTANDVFWQLTWEWDGAAATDTLHLSGIEITGSNFIDVQMPAWVLLDGNWRHIRIASSRLGADIRVWITITNTDGTDYTSYTQTPLLAGGIGRVSLLQSTSTTLTSGSVGHVVIHDTAAPADAVGPFTSYPGEYAGSRFDRLCTQAGITATIIGNPATDSPPMGPQPTLSLLQLLDDIIATDGGLLYETAGQQGLTMHLLGALCRQTPVATINVEADIRPPLDQIIGSDQARNVVTASRRSGASSVYEVTTGPLSTAAAPAGIGRQPTEVTVNPSTDAMLLHYASWVAASLTVGGVAYDQIVLDLDANPDLDITLLDIGSVINLTGVPLIDDPDPAPQLVVGIAESSTSHRRLITLTVTSAVPYQVAQADDAGYLDCGASTLNGDHTARTGTLTLAIADRCTWTHADGDYDVVALGERMTVTAVGSPTGSSGAWAQTLTVTRAVNGISKALPNGTEIHVADPFIPSLI